MPLATIGMGQEGKVVPLQRSVPVEEDTVVPAQTGEFAAEQKTPEALLLESLRSLNGPAPTVVTDLDEHWQVVRMKVTAYCPCPICCGKHSDGYTACNHRIRSGDVFVAADKKVPFGTEMVIPGYNDDQPVKVLDRGRLIKGNRLDIFMHSHRQALQWGCRDLDVLVRVGEGQ